ncbi:hypothetical protein BJX61DRAFT_546292 [Aspergillus egyptiacus]|nr:hypothetical protein BJX61DRAFT_546292 [Aspergillus egyptiacus]
MSQSTPPIPDRTADYERFKTYAAYTFLLASPILIALPPRKLDNFTVLLTASFGISANYLTYQHTGRSIVERLEAKIKSSSSHTPQQSSLLGGLPSERAVEIQEKMRAAREARLREEGISREEKEKLRRQMLQGKGVLERVWMGEEEEGWKEKRLVEERKALEEGKGYGDLIREHIWDVWTWGEKGKEKEAEGEGRKEE